jgi:fatty acid desaturase
LLPSSARSAFSAFQPWNYPPDLWHPMSAITKRALWREPEGAIPNTLALGYAVLGWLVSFAFMAADGWELNAVGVLLCAHTMVMAAYLIHETAHYTLFASPAVNRIAGEAMNFIAGSAYASFERIRHMHLRHHRDRADVTCFDIRTFLSTHQAVRRLVCQLEWAYVPAVEIIMHLQVIVRPFVEASQRKHLPRVVSMLVVRFGLLAALAAVSPKALVLYFIAYWILLTTLNFFDAFHHTFEQYFADADAPVPMNGRDRGYEQANTFSNVVSIRHPSLNLLTLNFGYHNAHHERAAVPWYRLPALHSELFGDSARELMPLSQLLRTFHANRLRRVLEEGYGEVGIGPNRADAYVGAHGVSFLTVV